MLLDAPMATVPTGLRSSNEGGRRLIVGLVLVVYLLLILEGVLRKWLFPEFGQILYFIRDPFVLFIYVAALATGHWPRREPWLAVGMVLGVFALLLAACSAGAQAAPPASATAAAPNAAPAAKPGKTPQPKAIDRVELDQTTITGNRELPNVMVIVPWKESLPGTVSSPPVPIGAALLSTIHFALAISSGQSSGESRNPMPPSDRTTAMHAGPPRCRGSPTPSITRPRSRSRTCSCWPRRCEPRCGRAMDRSCRKR